jgi:hypothetical protein
VQFFRVAAAALFLFAAMGGLGIAFHWSAETLLGVVACGLFCLAWSELKPPAPPSR